jgi:carboxyl-terminal processing protease
MLKKRILRGLLIAAPITIAATAPSGDSYFEVSKNMEIFSAMFKELSVYYVDDIEPNKSTRAAIDAMLEELDPYTNFISEAEMEGFRFQTTGRYGGIGAVIRTKEGFIGIVQVHDGAPAAKANLKAGDFIIAVDGSSTAGKPTDEVSKMLKGTPGTEVQVKVKHAITNEEEVVTLIREEIKVNNVPYYGMAADGIGFIRLEQFTEKAGQNVEDALKDLKKDNNLRGVILDLRGNPGGLLHEAVNVCNVFIPKNKLVVDTKGRVSDWDQTRKTLNDPIDTEIPVVVLTDNGSASASEIVAGTIQDYDRGVIMGSRTFGKGLVQQTRDLPYNTKLKLTIAKYYVPSGRCIQALDYSHREEDGSVVAVPDSLRRPFKTANGRVVYDGAGIEPDFAVEDPKIPQVLIALSTKDLIFDFATRYHHDHPELAGAGRFDVTDDIYQSFVAFVDGKDYAYQTRSEKAIEKLEVEAKTESYHDALTADIADLKSRIADDKKNDLEKHKEIIKEALEAEIVSRYYLRSGRIEASFDDDKDVLEAITLLKTPELYRQLLSP